MGFRLGNALACVIGSMDLVRPLGLAGIRCAVVARPGARIRYSRFTSAVVDWIDPWRHPEALVERLLGFGRAQDEPPVLYYEGDWDLLLVSRHRQRLREAFRFVVPESELVEDLVDKARFQALAKRLGLPVPASARLGTSVSPTELELRYPVVVKPLTRQLATWTPVGERAKAVRVDSAGELREVWSRLAAQDVDALAQELVPGPETLIESYHVYRDDSGETAGEFTGKKIRTHPAEFGYSTALEITRNDEVAELGREIVGKLDLRGVAKLDFKRDPDGTLRLLEINPRFNLWHHPAAKAGVNLPELVYRSLLGLPRPALASARAGTTWMNASDFRAARADHVPAGRWLRWVLACDAKSWVAWDDPMPVIGAGMSRLSRKLLQRREHASDRAPLDEGA